MYNSGKWCIRCGQPGHRSHACKQPIAAHEPKPAAAPTQPPNKK